MARRGRATHATARLEGQTLDQSGPDAAARIHRPQQDRSAFTVSAIDTVVDAMVIEGGIKALTAKEVARRAGVSPGTLYHYYRSRDALIAAWELRTMQRGMTQIHAVLAQAIDQSWPIEDAVWTISYRSVMVAFDTLWCARDGYVGFATSLPERREFVDRSLDLFAHAIATDARARVRLAHAELGPAIRATAYTLVFAPYPAALRHPTKAEKDSFARTMADMITRFLVLPPNSPSAAALARIDS